MLNRWKQRKESIRVCKRPKRKNVLLFVRSLEEGVNIFYDHLLKEYVILWLKLHMR